MSVEPDVRRRDADPGSAVTPEQVVAGQAVYSRRALHLYDPIVLGLSNRLIWKCPTPRLLTHYERHVTANHLDVGVGTGYFLDRCRFPSTTPRIALLDLNREQQTLLICVTHSSELAQRFPIRKELQDGKLVDA